MCATPPRAWSAWFTTGWSRGEGHFRPADEGRTISLSTMYLSSNYFSTIGVTLPLGPGFTPVDDASRAEPEGVISHRMWQVRFGSDPNIIGRAITINQTEYVVVGVAPERFRGHVGGLDEGHSQLWLPLSRHPRLHSGPTGTGNARSDREVSWLRVVARLSPGVTLAQADATVASVMAALGVRPSNACRTPSRRAALRAARKNPGKSSRRSRPTRSVHVFLGHAPSRTLSGNQS